MTTTEQQQPQKKVMKVEATHDIKLKSLLVAIASACIDRLGSESPAFEFAQNKFLLMDLKDLLIPNGIKYIMLSGGLCNDIHQSRECTEIYSIANNSFTPGPHMQHDHYEHDMVVVDAGAGGNCEIILMGGFSGGMAFDRMESLAISKDGRIDDTAEWHDTTSTTYREGVGICARAGVCTLGGSVYILGGSDDTKFLKSVEVHSESNGMWIDSNTEDPKPIPDMLSIRSSPGVVVVGKNIYVIGGQDGSRPSLSTVEVLNTETRSWSTCAPMKTGRIGFGTAVVEDRYIWVFGGWDSRDALDSIEVFDTEKNVWFASPIRLPSPRSWLKAFTVDRRIITVGGVSSGAKVRCIEALDLDSAEWSVLARFSDRDWCGIAGF